MKKTGLAQTREKTALITSAQKSMKNILLRNEKSRLEGCARLKRVRCRTLRSLQQRQLQSSLPQSSQSGFTIIECMIAVVVVSILMMALSPVIVLSVVNRVQARRVELATQAARAYIDGVRNGTIDPPSNTILLSNYLQRGSFATATPPTTGTSSLSSCPTTAGNQYCQNASATTASLYCIDIDGSGCSSTSNTSRDLIIQAFRSVTSNSTDPNQGYLLGLRVYRADAFYDNVALTFATQAPVAGGLSNRKAPLVVMTTEIVTSKTNYANFCSRISGC